MASRGKDQPLLQKISERHLECQICIDRFKEPKMLECSHSFCLKCLQPLAEEQNPSTQSLSISCPVCRGRTLLTGKGVADLRTDFRLISLLDEIKQHETELQSQQESQPPSQGSVSKCSKHTHKEVIMYCDTCKQLICTTCIAKDHSMHHFIELNDALDKCKNKANKLFAEVDQFHTDFEIALKDIAMSHKTLDSVFAATKAKISKKANQEVASIRKEEQKLMVELQQIYNDRAKTMENAEARQAICKLTQKKWMLKKIITNYKNRAKQTKQFSPCDIAVYSNSDIIVSDLKSCSLIQILAESTTALPIAKSIKDLNYPSRVTVNRNDDLIGVDYEAIKICNRNYELLHQFVPDKGSNSEPSCIAVDDNNLIAVSYRNKAVSYRNKAEISLHQPDGSLIRTLPAPGIGRYLTTQNEQLIYTDWDNKKLVSVDYYGHMVLSVDIYQSGWPRGVCCDMDGSIYVAVGLTGLPSSSGEIQHYSPNGNYIRRITMVHECPHGIMLTPSGDLVVTTEESVKIYHHVLTT